MRTLLCLLALSAGAFSAELPVRHVVLYKNGVGYFERAGKVEAGEAAQLAFKQSEMNDILKSLTVRDSSGNTVRGVRYDSAEPLESKLSTFPFETGEDKPSLSSFLNRLRGARLNATLAGEKLSGTIMLARTTAGSKEQPEREQLVLLLDSGEIRTLDLSAVSGLQFADPALQDRLRDYLRIFGQTISADKRVVTIDSDGKTVRSLIASYMVPSPVWKSSYRLLFTSEGEPVLEGWAIVDNTTGEDWSGVQLSLVSGRPVSFISNLFETRNIERTVADLPELAAVNPVLYEGAVSAGAPAGIVGGVPGGKAGGVIGGIMGAVPSAAPPPPPAAKRFEPPSSVMPQPERDMSTIDVQGAAAREVADLFEYRFETPVTIRAGESAMLPFLQQKIAARKLLIYSDRSSVHPMSAVELTNSTGKTLDGGPVTVFESASYAGEALMATLKSADERLIGYAIDLGTRVATKVDSGSQEIRELHLRRGVLSMRMVQRSTLTYTIRNVDKRAKTLVIEHPIRSNYKLVGTKPARTTANMYRFEVKLEPSSEQAFPVVEEHEFQSSVIITSLTPSVLATYIEGRTLSASGRKALEQIVSLKQKIDDMQQLIRTVDGEAQRLERDGERVRQNIASLKDVPGQGDQVQRYARQLGDLDTNVTALRDQQAELNRQRTQMETDLNTLIGSAEF